MESCGINKEVLLEVILKEVNRKIAKEAEKISRLPPEVVAKMMEDPPPEVQVRVNALKNIQLEMAHVEADFFKELHELEMKYSTIRAVFFEKRREIVNGKYEPTAEECLVNAEGSGDKESKTGDGNGDIKLDEDLKKLKLSEKTTDGVGPTVSGIPNFWLKVFRNTPLLTDVIQDHDEPILKHLIDVNVEMTAKPMGFKLHFQFSPNEYFTNTVLTKSYEMKCEADPKDPYILDGPEIFKCSGTEIDWKKGMALTEVGAAKKNKKQKQGEKILDELISMAGVTLSSKPGDFSFFEFFKPPTLPSDIAEGLNLGDLDNLEQAEAKACLYRHYQAGQILKERIIPRAVLYYTGEAQDVVFDEEETDDEETETDDSVSEGAHQGVPQCQQT